MSAFPPPGGGTPTVGTPPTKPAPNPGGGTPTIPASPV